MIEEGKRAPAFSLLDQHEEKVALKDYKDKTIVLYFYPKDLTPGCTTEAEDFRDLNAKFKRAGAVIFGVSRDPVERHQKFSEKLKLNFSLLSDEDGKICEKYGVWQEKKLYGKTFMGIVRSTFIISNGKVVKVYPKVKVKGHAEAVLAEVKAL